MEILCAAVALFSGGTLLVNAKVICVKVIMKAEFCWLGFFFLIFILCILLSRALSKSA